MPRHPMFARAAGRLLCCTALMLVIGDASRAAAIPPGAVDAARLQAADSEPQNWYTGGRDQGGTYYSPLATINASNVQDLGFAWDYDLGSPLRGQEATPVVIDGIMYTSGTWGYVYAVNAATGREVWRYDPHSDFFAGRNPCCDLVNRVHAQFKDIVLHGALAPAGMERFDDLLSEQDVDNIHAYVIDQAWVAYRAQEAAAHK